jgi:hypothetical protein
MAALQRGIAPICRGSRMPPPSEMTDALPQLRTSSGLLFEVFCKHGAGNLLRGRAQAEVLRREFDIDWLAAALSLMLKSAEPLVER